VERTTQFVKKSLKKIHKIVYHPNLIELSVTSRDYRMRTASLGIIGRVFIAMGISPGQKW
jgi:hypothetical protein